MSLIYLSLCLTCIEKVFSKYMYIEYGLVNLLLNEFEPIWTISIRKNFYTMFFEGITQSISGHTSLSIAHQEIILFLQFLWVTKNEPLCCSRYTIFIDFLFHFGNVGFLFLVFPYGLICYPYNNVRTAWCPLRFPYS